MIPILFNSHATTFATNGIGRLTDTISCTVKESKGEFELEMVYPVTGVNYSNIKVGHRVVVKPNLKQDRQAFEIYKISKPINGKVTINANHISYLQSYVPIKPFSAEGITNTIAGLGSNALETNNFTFTTDLTNESSAFNLTVPTSLRRCLGGMEGSISDVFSGSSGIEYLWDNFNTFITLNRGEDNGVTLRYKKNIVDLEQTESIEDMETGVLPIWTNSDGTVSFYGDIYYTSTVDDYGYHRTTILDLSDEFDEAPTESQLNTARQNYVNKASVGIPNTNIKVSFVDLSKASLFENPSVLESVNLYDTIHVIYTPLGISYDAKVCETEWDVLKDRYAEVQIGDLRNNIAQTIQDSVSESTKDIVNGKLISVTQTVDRELGVIESTIASVDETAQGTVRQLNETIDSLDEYKKTIGEQITGLDGSVTNLSTSFEQTSSSFTMRINNIVEKQTEQGEEIEDLSAWFQYDSDGLTIGKEASDIKLELSNDELAFTDDDDNKLAWLDADEGLGATGLSIGSATTKSNRWRVFTRGNGSHLTFTRHN